MHPMFKELFIGPTPKTWWPRRTGGPRAPVPASPIGHDRQVLMAMTPGPGQSATVRDG